MKEKEVLARLRRQFVNAKGSKAEYSEITILDMVKEAIPSKVEPQGKDVLSLTEALYVRLLAGRLAGKETSEKELIKKIMACHNSDGGFAWYEGMESSRTITAVVMERFWRLRKEGFELPDIDSAAKFLDRTQFGRIFPTWCGWLSDAQYMYVRSCTAKFLSPGPHPCCASPSSARKPRSISCPLRERTAASRAGSSTRPAVSAPCRTSPMERAAPGSLPTGASDPRPYPVCRLRS